uniref:Uncharacterized protein n=1 Tax=Aegilops tauschii subsp. strangulata TaxID=200361 RepID=A0A453GY04_AEGTS
SSVDSMTSVFCSLTNGTNTNMDCSLLMLMLMLVIMCF